jgi:hypothetical protein
MSAGRPSIPTDRNKSKYCLCTLPQWSQSQLDRYLFQHSFAKRNKSNVRNNEYLTSVHYILVSAYRILR